MRRSPSSRRSWTTSGARAFMTRANSRAKSTVSSPVRLADDDAADPDNPALPGSQITFKIAIVLLAIRRRHELADILADHILGSMIEQPFGRSAEPLDNPGYIDHDHGIRYRVENRLEMGLTGHRGARTFGGRSPGVAESLADPGGAYAQEGENGST